MRPLYIHRRHRGWLFQVYWESGALSMLPLFFLVLTRRIGLVLERFLLSEPGSSGGAQQDGSRRIGPDWWIFSPGWRQIHLTPARRIWQVIRTEKANQR